MPKQLEGEYMEALLAEIAACEWRDAPETVYLGGGTPSNIEPDLLARILAALPRSAFREATLEAAPGTLTDEKVAAWQKAGINRVSLGVQSFVRAELARTGRRHDAEVVARDVSLLRSHGIESVNIDLIAGLPGQTAESWRTSLSGALALEPPHVSVYMLEVDDDSRLGAEILLGGARYGAQDVPAEEAVAEFYETAVETLARHGIQRYEISNFGRSGAESLHNLKYWRREPYMGFGADAHSFDGSTRWQNVETARDYVAAWRHSRSPRVSETAAIPSEEKFFVGLRLAEGVDVDNADRARYGAAFERFIAGGLMEFSGDRIRLTPRGIMVSNEIFQEFVSA